MHVSCQNSRYLFHLPEGCRIMRGFWEKAQRVGHFLKPFLEKSLEIFSLKREERREGEWASGVFKKSDQ